MGYYSANPHYAPVDLSEQRERIARYEREAHRWFDDLTGPQLAKFRQSMADAQPYLGSPRWDRIKDAAQREWQVSTKDARGVYNLILADLLATGEVSEASAHAFNVCAAQAAE